MPPVAPQGELLRGAVDGQKAAKKLLYYRNPMGLPDTSPVPKKDPMGMDYLPVYEGEDDGDSGLKISAEKIQKLGVKSEPAKNAGARQDRARQRPRRDRREPHLHGHRQVRGLHRAPAREHQRPAGRPRAAAVRGVQPGTGVGPARIRHRRAGRRPAERGRRRSAGGDEATRRIQPAAAEELGHFRGTGQGAGQVRRCSKTHA
jgi:hypothetical protein